MRFITLLRADRQLTKTFFANGKSEPYPLVSNFTSTPVKYETIDELFQIIEHAANTGNCILKGPLTRPIQNESRAGLCDTSAATDLLVIDYDADDGFESFDALLTAIDPRLASTDYIFQHSASAGIKSPAGLRGHAFFLLTTPVAPAMIKQWLKKINLISEPFRDKVKLSRNAMALCYALDLTVNQNDKLIYVAPPKLIGIEDPVPERFLIRRGTHRTYPFSASVSMELNRTKEHELIEDLQDASGLPKRTPKYKVVGAGELLVNPAQCTVTDVKECGKYVRVNLNGGDSFAYWYHKDDPEILYNFKGEPAVRLADVAPDYYEQLQRLIRARVVRPFILRDISSDVYYAAEYDDSTNKLVSINRVNKRGTLLEFMVQRGQPAPKVIPDWDIVFDPSSHDPVNFTERRINTFKSSPYLEALPGPETTSHFRFPIIHKIISHLCVDTPTYEHFMDWLAHIVQFRTKTQTAWIFSGTEGTGKGTLFHKILTPLFGDAHCSLLQQENVDEQFNGYLLNNLILFLDEGDIETARSANKILAKFRTLITEPVVPIRLMRANTFIAPNYSNLIIATNQYLPVRLTASDRRYNVAPRQHEKIFFDPGEVDAIEEELHAFTSFLKHRKITVRTATIALENEAKDTLLELSRTVAEEFFCAIRTSELDFFTERLLDVPPIPDNGYVAYARHIQNWMLAGGKLMQVPLDDLVVVYRYISGNISMTPKRFAHLASRYALKSYRARINGIQRQVFDMQFARRDYTEWFERHTKPEQPPAPTKVTPIRKRREEEK